MPSHYGQGLIGDLPNFLESDPDLLFQTLRPMRGSSSFVNYWRARQGDVWGGYLGALGRQAQAGVVPSLTRTEFLGSFPFQEKFDQLSPQRRGTQTARFRPRARFNV